MPAPLEDVHHHLGRVRELDEEDLLARDVADGPRIQQTREDMEGVLTRSAARGGRPSARSSTRGGSPRRESTRPGPRTRSACRARAPARRPCAAAPRDSSSSSMASGWQLAQTRIRSVHPGSTAMMSSLPSKRRIARACCASVMPSRSRKGREHLDLQIEFVAAFLDPAWGPQAAEQVLVEDLDPVEPGVCHRGELLIKGAGQGDRGDRPTHSWTVATGMRRGHPLADQWQELAAVPAAPLCRAPACVVRRGSSAVWGAHWCVRHLHPNG